MYEMKKEAGIDAGYELYQIINDFDNPVQIFREAFQNSFDEDADKVYCNIRTDKRLGLEDLYIEIWDNGTGLSKANIDYFFGLAKSTKIDSKKVQKSGKQGYKGHGTKIFFNAERIEIISKTSNEHWGAVLDNPVKQIREINTYKYSDFIEPSGFDFQLPEEFDTGFYLRIKNPHYFKTKHTQFMLNHLYLRDYAMWHTVFGSIFESPQSSNRKLFLKGMNIENFKETFHSIEQIDPKPIFTNFKELEFEEIRLGHYFPDLRHTDTSMKNYVKKIGVAKPYYDYYSKEIFNNTVYLDSDISFKFILRTEGYETKRRYDILLSRRGKAVLDKNLTHTDGERYGLWACKKGVPIEKVDDWILGGKGVGTYTYMHAFVDCEQFELTANRSSVRNTNQEILEKIQNKINEILNDKTIQKELKERQGWEDLEKRLRGIEEDENELKERYSSAKKKKGIILPNGKILQEPTKSKSGYSESETLILLMQLISEYPDLFPFTVLDYNTAKGIDFVIDRNGTPKYIELKGTLQKKINHSFRNVYKFICYETDLKDGDILTDVEPLQVKLKLNRNDKFQSFDENFKGKSFVSYQLIPETTVIDYNIEIIRLKDLLINLIKAKIE